MASTAGRTGRLSLPVQGALLMVGASACWAAMSGLIRFIAEGLHPFEIAFFRTFIALLIMLPWVLRSGMPHIPRRDRPIFVVRAVLHSADMLLWFLGVTLMPLAMATALYFTAPFFATILAVIFLGEVVRARRWTAVAIGFLGAMVVLRPGVETITVASLVILGCAVTSAGSRISVRLLASRGDPKVIVAGHYMLLTPITLVAALFFWTWPTWEQLAWLTLLAGVGTLGHIMLTQAYVVAEASEIAPFDFTQLVVAVLIGIFVFSEVPDVWTWVGSAIIAGSAVYVARREALLRRAQGAAPTVARQIGRHA